MRKKIKELLNKEEGFTLVELLAVLVILAIIIAIAVPAVGNVVDDSRIKADNAETELVIDAAQLYFVAVPENTHNNTVTVETLINTGYLENDEDLDGSKEVKRTKVAEDSQAYKYEYDGKTTSGAGGDGD